MPNQHTPYKYLDLKHVVTDSLLSDSACLHPPENMDETRYRLNGASEYVHSDVFVRSPGNGEDVVHVEKYLRKYAGNSLLYFDLY